jgi:hypothetical protein
MKAKKMSSPCGLLVEHFLPEVVDALREAAAVARAAEEELATGFRGDGFVLLVEQQASLQGVIALLRAIDFACSRSGERQARSGH